MDARPVVLACEDEAQIIELLRQLVQPLGADVVSATDGMAALARLAERRPSIVTLDLVLPQLDGFGVLERMRLEPALQDVPVLVLSALCDHQNVKRAYDLGATDFVAKPFNVYLLDAKLRVLLRQSRRFEEAQRLGGHPDSASEVSGRAFLHEVRNPLAAIGAAAQVIARDDCERAQGVRLARAIEGEAARISALLDEYVEARIRPVVPRDVDVPALLREVVEVNLLDSPARTRISIACASALPTVRADGARLKQVVLNLLLNAVKATDAGGQITLDATPHGTGLALRVSDTGCGIPENDLPRIFDETFSTREGGGLGLPIARRIVEQHGGDIRVESAPGRGTTFTVWLPLTAAQS